MNILIFWMKVISRKEHSLVNLFQIVEIQNWINFQSEYKGNLPYKDCYLGHIVAET